MQANADAIRFLVVFIAAMAFSACGFRLAGTANLPPSLSSMTLVTSGLGEAQRDALRRQLSRAGAELKNPGDPEAVVLKVAFNVLPDRRLLSSASDGKSVERLTRSLDFSLSSAGGEVLLPGRTLTQQNDIVLDDDNLLASTREKASVLEDLEQALFEQLIRQLKRI
jgi:LPS-assembly lipoprotein